MRLSTARHHRIHADGTRRALLEGLPTLRLWSYVWPNLLIGAIAILAGLWSLTRQSALQKGPGSCTAMDKMRFKNVRVKRCFY